MTSETTEALWSPTAERIASTQLTVFMQSVKDATGFDAGGDYFALHQWSLDEPAASIKSGRILYRLHKHCQLSGRNALCGG